MADAQNEQAITPGGDSPFRDVMLVVVLFIVLRGSWVIAWPNDEIPLTSTLLRLLVVLLAYATVVSFGIPISRMSTLLIVSVAALLDIAVGFVSYCLGDSNVIYCAQAGEVFVLAAGLVFSRLRGRWPRR